MDENASNHRIMKRLREDIDLCVFHSLATLQSMSLCRREQEMRAERLSNQKLKEENQTLKSLNHQMQDVSSPSNKARH